MSEQERLMRRINSYQFASWELHIYLDTHPNDCKAAKQLEEYRKMTDELVAQYETTYGPMHMNSSRTSRYAWISDPWPWDLD
jgi:spore coat protein JB